MSDHDTDDCQHLVRASLLEAEVARLKAEVERLKEGNDCLGQMHDKEMERSAYLLEEFNRTTAWGRGLESDLSHARVEISFLKAEVERLTERNKFLEQIDSYLQGANENAYEKRCDELEAEVERLTLLQVETLNERNKAEAEVERLRASSFVTAVPVEQYERLRKAGDEVCESPYLLETDPAVIAWRAAKEGKQP